jgi:hypothetical protein
MGGLNPRKGGERNKERVEGNKILPLILYIF